MLIVWVKTSGCNNLFQVTPFSLSSSWQSIDVLLSGEPRCWLSSWGFAEDKLTTQCWKYDIKRIIFFRFQETRIIYLIHPVTKWPLFLHYLLTLYMKRNYASWLSVWLDKYFSPLGLLQRGVRHSSGESRLEGELEIFACSVALIRFLSVWYHIKSACGLNFSCSTWYQSLGQISRTTGRYKGKPVEVTIMTRSRESGVGGGGVRKEG